jgi:ABC-type phosphate transport system substrate-binding protein
MRRALLGIALLIALAPVRVATADDTPIGGEGSTWAANALDQWRLGGNEPVNYAAVGSTQGRADFRNGTVDFAVSELEYGPGDPPPSRDFAYLPLLGGGTAFAYNLRIGAPVRLSGDTIAKIFTRAITSWDDPAIRTENPA